MTFYLSVPFEVAWKCETNRTSRRHPTLLKYTFQIHFKIVLNKSVLFDNSIEVNRKQLKGIPSSIMFVCKHLASEHNNSWSTTRLGSALLGDVIFNILIIRGKDGIFSQHDRVIKPRFIMAMRYDLIQFGLKNSPFHVFMCSRLK